MIIVFILAFPLLPCPVIILPRIIMLIFLDITKDKIIGIRDLMEETLRLAREKLPDRVYSKELIELLFYQPYTKGKFLEDAGIVKRQTAAEYLKELEKIKVLKLQKTGKENLYLNVKLYDLLSK